MQLVVNEMLNYYLTPWEGVLKVCYIELLPDFSSYSID